VFGSKKTISLGTGVPAQSQLTSIVWQDGSVRRYHHEDGRWPQAVTGITDEAGVRYGTYAYDAQGRVTRSELTGGAERLDFAYASDASGKPTTTVTDYSGAGGAATTRTYTFTDIGNVRYPSTLTAPCSLCGSTQQSSTYDANGNPTKQIAHDGSVTFIAYDARGRETERAVFPASYNTAATRPALANATRVISTQWHATFNLPTQVAEPNKTTANTYSSKGLLSGQSWTATTDATGAAKFTAVKTGSTYATGWGYNANGLLTSLVRKTDGVATAQTTYVVNTLGITTKATNALTGKAISISATNANGSPTSGSDATGTPFSIAYSSSGRPTSMNIGTQPANRLVYDERGSLSRIEAADGSIVTLTPPATGAAAQGLQAQASAAAAVSAAFSPVSGSASACSATGLAVGGQSMCCSGAPCRVYCFGAPGNAPVYCTRVEYSTGSGWRTTNFGLYSWLDRPFNFVGQFTCTEFDQLLGDGRCGNGACLAAANR
jgi:YD repeat-containing protein